MPFWRRRRHQRLQRVGRWRRRRRHRPGGRQRHWRGTVVNPWCPVAMNDWWEIMWCCRHAYVRIKMISLIFVRCGGHTNHESATNRIICLSCILNIRILDTFSIFAYILPFWVQRVIYCTVTIGFSFIRYLRNRVLRKLKNSASKTVRKMATLPWIY